MPGFPNYPINGSIGDNSGVYCPELMDMEEEHYAGKSKRLSELFFLQKVLREKSGDSSAITNLALSVHAIMLASGFVLLGFSPDKFSFWRKLPSISLKYTLPEVIKISRKENKKLDYVTVIFRNLGGVVVVNGNLDGYSETVHKTYLDKSRFLTVIRLVVSFLKFEEQVSSNIYRDVFVLWRMVKDYLVLPLLIDICDKTGLESPPCLMSLPTELKEKILESLSGVSIGYMACVCKEIQNLTSNNDLWKLKYVEECLGRYDRMLKGEGNWKNAYAQVWLNKRRNFPIDTRFSKVRGSRTRVLTWLGGDRFSEEYIQVHEIKRAHRFPMVLLGFLILLGIVRV